MNISDTVAPKSDQLTADDLLAAPRTITITRATRNEGSADQPVNLWFQGDDGKPYRPCKTDRRMIISMWGADTADYVGRSLTLYRNGDVVFGGMKVGGIRISHASHINGAHTLAVTVTRAQKKPYTVKPLTIEPAKPNAQSRAVEDAWHEAKGAAARGTDAFRAWCKANPIWKQFMAEDMQALKEKCAAADAADAPADPVAALTPDQIESAMAKAAREFLAGDE